MMIHAPTTSSCVACLVPFSTYNQHTMEQLSIEDEEEWAREQGVPSFEEPMIQRYLQGRDALSAQEKKQRSGSLVHEV